MYGDRSELVEARRDFITEFLTLRADVGHGAGTSNGAGGQKATPEFTERNLRAKISTSKIPSLTVEGSRPVSLANWEIALADEDANREPGELKVRAGYQVIVGLRKFRVVATDAGRNDALCLRVEAIQIS